MTFQNESANERHVSQAGTLTLGDLTINRLGFGAMRLSANGFQGPPRDPEAGCAVLRRAVELGVNHIDTAAFYQSLDGSVRANTLIREALSPYPPDLVIATKVGPVPGPNGPVPATAAGLRAQVEDNLKALGLSRLDLVYLRIGFMEPPHGESLAEQFEVLAALREEGLIRHLGLSNVDSAHLTEARTIAPVVAVQNHFHIAKRDEVVVLDACTANGIAFAPFFPLGGGRTDLNNERLARVATRHAATVSQIALAWLLALSPVTIAIPGTGSLAHLEENIATGSIALTPQDLADLHVTEGEPK
ncbi:oxidoreductase [Ktedonobacter sp. SOSP1-85]|nr:oxidoreductase [Ktedonobacter sp. SOSP1-85]